jgi:hypothetical protein
MPRPEFGTAPFCGGNAASSGVIKGAATAVIGPSVTNARKAAAKTGINDCLIIEFALISEFEDDIGLWIWVNDVRRRR